MKNISFKLPYLNLALALASSLLLLGFFWPKSNAPTLSTDVITLYQSQAMWKKFLGYDLNAYKVRLSSTIKDAYLIVSNSNKMYLLDPMNGNRNWWVTTRKSENFTSPAGTYQGMIVIASDEPRLFAFDIQSEKIIWSVELPHRVYAQPAVDGKQVVVKTIAGEVLAFHANNGKLCWKYKISDIQTTDTMLHTSSAPQFSEDTVFVGLFNGRLLALDRSNGSLLWEHTVHSTTHHRTEIDRLVDIASDPVVDTEAEVIYANAYHGKLQCLDMHLGEVKWEQKFSSYLPLVLSKDILYGIDEEHSIYAFDTANGAVIWKQDEFKAIKITGPSLSSNKKYLIIGDEEGHIYWLSKEKGGIVARASFNFASPIVSNPIEMHETVYALTRQGVIAAWKLPSVSPSPIATQERHNVVGVEGAANRSEVITPQDPLIA
jgi:outer membrane protein assembly factor BamB